MIKNYSHYILAQKTKCINGGTNLKIIKYEKMIMVVKPKM